MDWRTFLTVFVTVFLAELGDKTQLATLLFATKAPSALLAIFLGAASARDHVGDRRRGRRIARRLREPETFPTLRASASSRLACGRCSRRRAERSKLARMTPIRTFNTRVEAELARIALSAEGIQATVVGLDVALEGGAEGVRLLVADDQADAARRALAKGQSSAGKKPR
jgi:uncharacterized protein UPF0016/putative signal transducing protein